MLGLGTIFYNIKLDNILRKFAHLSKQSLYNIIGYSPSTPHTSLVVL